MLKKGVLEQKQIISFNENILLLLPLYREIEVHYMHLNWVTHGTQLTFVTFRIWIIEIQRNEERVYSPTQITTDEYYSGDLTIKKSPVASRSDSNTVTLKT